MPEGAPRNSAILTVIQLRVLVTSRPDTPIRLGFRKMAGILHRDLVLHNVPREITDHDITIQRRRILARRPAGRVSL